MTAMPEVEPFALEMLDVHKSYGPVRALRGVTLRVRRGSIHAVMGENGAGKSTLIETLAGTVTPDAGEIRVAGNTVELRDARAARSLGIAVVHQQLSLAPTVTVAENMLVGRMPKRGWLVDWDRLHREAADVLDRHGVEVDTHAMTGDLPVGLQQQVEIARALSGNARVLALDEPTSSLSLHESNQLFEQMRRLRSLGVAVIIITHRVDDAFSLADRGTVLRDGSWVGDFESGEVSEAQIVNMMIGRPLTTVYPEKRKATAPTEPPLLHVEGVRSGDAVIDGTLSVAAGEVVGVYGLVGAGRSELAETIFGLRRRTAGSITVDGRPLPMDHTVPQAMRAGIALLPEDRSTSGLFADRTIAENICAPRLAAFGTILLGEGRMEADARKAIDAFAVQWGPDMPVGNLSGGNQQKVLFGRWWATNPRVLIVDEPTRGVDIGTKADIHKAIRRLADDGAAVLLISSEMPEVLGMSDRIYVMSAGRIVDELPSDVATENRLLVSSSILNRGPTEGMVA